MGSKRRQVFGKDGELKRESKIVLWYNSEGDGHPGLCA